MYKFYIEFDDGSKHVESGLTKRQAVIRYNKLARSDWGTMIVRYGWKLEETV
jgi:hypothetical protein